MNNKYHAVKTQIDGYTFDSKAEGERYLELKSWSQQGKISAIEVHPRFLLQEGGNGMRPIYYVADFKYLDENSNPVIEDVKGVETAVFKLKKKLFQARYPELELRVIK
jgi:hypothetical protein